MRILVTGGAGFIGSHLCERLLGEGHDVICLDNFFTGSRDNIIHLMDNHRFEVVRHDIIQPILLEVDRIYNLACPASPIHYQYNPVKTTKTSVMGVINMLGLAKRVKARILQASTSEVYGDPQVHPQPESYWGNVNPIGPRGVYDEAKRFAEAMTMAYHRFHGVNTHIVRIFNTYGPRMRPRDGRVVPAFISEALKNEPITVFGDGSQTRSFCYVADLIAGIFKLAQSSYHEPVNIGNPQEMTVRIFAEKIRALCGSTAPIVYRPLPVDDPKVRQPNIALARQLLGWEPQVGLNEGLARTIEYFRGLLARGAL
jgi:UDP-glucuronate decarboxylase